MRPFSELKINFDDDESLVIKADKNFLKKVINNIKEDDITHDDMTLYFNKNKIRYSMLTTNKDDNDKNDAEASG